MSINIIIQQPSHEPSRESMLLKMLMKSEEKKKVRHSELLKQLQKTDKSIDLLPHAEHVGGG